MECCSGTAWSSGAGKWTICRLIVEGKCPYAPRCWSVPAAGVQVDWRNFKSDRKMLAGPRLRGRKSPCVLLPSHGAAKMASTSAIASANNDSLSGATGSNTRFAHTQPFTGGAGTGGAGLVQQCDLTPPRNPRTSPSPKPRKISDRRRPCRHQTRSKPRTCSILPVSSF